MIVTSDERTLRDIIVFVAETYNSEGIKLWWSQSLSSFQHFDDGDTPLGVVLSGNIEKLKHLHSLTNRFF